MSNPLNTRREFLQKGLTLLAITPTVPAFLSQTVYAIADPFDVKRTQQPSGADGKVLVVVQLSGGNDGLNTVIPYADDIYYRKRPALGVEAKTILKVTDHVGLHPNLAPMQDLFEDGKLAILQGVGYPNPNRSHFRSMDIWQSAQPEIESPRSGWVGRYFDNACAGCDPHVGVSIGELLPLAMQGERLTPLSFERPESYRYTGQTPSSYQKLIQPKDTAAKDETSPQAQLEFLRRTALDAQLSSDRILRITRGHSPKVAYPRGEFGDGLRTIAAMIHGGLPTRVYYVSLTGFDTHAGQKNRHEQLLKQLADGLSAFWKDLEAQRNAERVLVMTFSEFGRRVEQNSSGGTDHGAAAPMFLLGRGVKQGLLGKHPSLSDLDQGDLKFAIDFRSVYSTVLEKWLETPTKAILGGAYPLLPVIG